ncbi:alpha-hydroxy-acid oxidizing protein [Prescottella sp. R16]|uniref:alpha-hydroxy-acid oxidizing protein n=1 Tax=Prescottella sp. R16 TaxID=3064529 RepID=UPI00272EDB41|nr:alpha-hydroxy-acid oxidizing protein [Prescottella sp. R16]
MQNEIYLTGLSGACPELPMTAAGLEARARDELSAEAFAYIAGSASTERTAAANLDAFTRHALVPRMLRGTSAPDGRDLSIDLLGTRLSAPVLTAPVGVLGMIREHGETIVGEVAAELGVGSVLSTASSSTVEDVGAVSGENWWYQLYWPADDELARSLVQRAAKAGAKAIVVTADTPGMGWRPRDLEMGHLPFLRAQGIANYLSDPVFRAKLATPPEESPEAMQMAVLTWVSLFGNHTLRASDIAKIRQWTGLPVLVKGILHEDDARAVVDAGADGVVVSNHGGRQVDGAIAALDALGPVAAAVGDRSTILLDSGIRCGADVLIALALGADAVLYGRPWVYGLGLAGADGVRHALRILLADMDVTMGLAGLPTLEDIDAGILRTIRR